MAEREKKGMISLIRGYNRDISKNGGTIEIKGFNWGGGGRIEIMKLWGVESRVELSLEFFSFFFRSKGAQADWGWAGEQIYWEGEGGKKIEWGERGMGGN